jgi:hypothetical protein
LKKQNAIKIVAFTFLFLLCFIPLVAGADWSIGPNWLGGTNWNLPIPTLSPPTPTPTPTVTPTPTPSPTPSPTPIASYAITASANIGGTIAPTGAVNIGAGGSQIFTATASFGYHITNYVVDGAVVAAAGTYTFTNVLATHTITVNFATDLYNITASSDANCWVSPTGIVPVNFGNSPTFTYGAYSGYQIDQILVDGNPVSISSTEGSYTFTSVSANHTIAVSSSALTVVTPTPTPSPTPPANPNPHNHPLQTLNLYMRSDNYNFTTISAYGLDTDYTNNYISIPISNNTVNATVTYGFRIYIATDSTHITELTNGAPQAQIAISSNFTGQLSSSWTSPDTTILLGYQVIKIDLYAKINNGSWTAQASYITNPLITNELMPTTWTFTLPLTILQTTTNTTCTYTFGDTNNRATVTGIQIVTPNYTEIQSWQWTQGDIIGLIIGSYLNTIGGAFYVLIFLTVFGSLYFRHKNVGPIILVAILFGGGTGLSVWILMPAWAATVFSILIILATAAIIFKVVR